MRIQLQFGKTDAMRFTSHLDLQRALERNFRRAGLPLAYSQGYNPRPRIVLASPLPLGFTSEGELAEAWLKERLELDDILSALAHSAPPGITYNHIELVEDGTAKLPARLLSAVYVATPEGPGETLGSQVADLLAAESLPRERKGKPYDLRPLIESLSVAPANGAGQPALKMRLSARPGETGRPEEVLEALGLVPDSARFHRLQLIMSK